MNSFRLFAVAGVLFSAAWVQAGQVPPSYTKPEISAHELVREMVYNEVRSQKKDQAYWRFWEIDRNLGITREYEVDETPEGLAKVLVAVNGQTLPLAQQRKQKARLRKLLNNPTTARKAAQARHHDGEQERKMLAMLPKAFLFHYAPSEGNLIRVDFEPNPNFSPPSREAQVFHHMAGYILIDPQEKRLVEIHGELMSEVKFMWGLLGYLNKGGTFFVRQVNLGENHWRLSRLRVNMQGKALFFETIGVQQDQWFKNYRPNPSGITLAKAVAELERTAYSSKSSPEVN